MAADPHAARAFLLKVWPTVVAHVKREVADMQAVADRDPSTGSGSPRATSRGEQPGSASRRGITCITPKSA